jgi:hypothetical protein
MRELPLTQGKVALVDDEDFARASQFKWTAMKIYRRKREMWYARRAECLGRGKSRTILLHRFLMDAPQGMEVDHVSGDGLDNRRSSNLRLATRSQNSVNSHRSRKAASGYRGVYSRPNGKFHSKIMFQSKVLHIGIFVDAAKAAAAYDAKARELFGEFATVNF